MPAEVTCGAAPCVWYLVAPSGIGGCRDKTLITFAILIITGEHACAGVPLLFNDDSKAYQLQSTPKNRAPLITTFQFCY